MLNLYRRHQIPCRYRSRRYRNCKCPVWVQGSLRGEYIRRALNLRSWSAATDLVRDWEASGEIGVVRKPDIPTIAEAVEKFLADIRAQQLTGETIRKYENLLNRRGEAFDLLQALNTGHAGSMTTIHAKSAVHALSRCATCVVQADVGLPYAAITRLIADSVHLVVHVVRVRGYRRASEVVRVIGVDPEGDRFQTESLTTAG